MKWNVKDEHDQWRFGEYWLSWDEATQVLTFKGEGQDTISANLFAEKNPIYHAHDKVTSDRWEDLSSVRCAWTRMIDLDFLQAHSCPPWQTKFWLRNI